jgi:predicted nucleic acid-binding protein
MKVFLDTNVVIDFYDKRGEFYFPAAVILDLAFRGKIELYVSSVTFVNAFFLLRKSYDRHELYQSMMGLASLCRITPVDEEVIKKSLEAGSSDFEDRVQYESSRLHNVDVIVTRNVKDFKDFEAEVETPRDFLDRFIQE